MTKLHNSQTATEEQMSQVTQTKKFVPKVYFYLLKKLSNIIIFTNNLHIFIR